MFIAGMKKGRRLLLPSWSGSHIHIFHPVFLPHTVGQLVSVMHYYSQQVNSCRSAQPAFFIGERKIVLNKAIGNVYHGIARAADAKYIAAFYPVKVLMPSCS